MIMTDSCGTLQRFILNLTIYLDILIVLTTKIAIRFIISKSLWYFYCNLVFQLSFIAEAPCVENGT